MPRGKTGTDRRGLSVETHPQSAHRLNQIDMPHEVAVDSVAELPRQA